MACVGGRANPKKWEAAKKKFVPNTRAAKAARSR